MWGHILVALTLNHVPRTPSFSYFDRYIRLLAPELKVSSCVLGAGCCACAVTAVLRNGSLCI